MESMKIFKYPVELFECEIEIPNNVRILSFQLQNDVPTIWALVNENEEKIKRHFRFFGTGEYLPEDILKNVYIGTVIIKGYVWHLWEGKF